MADDFSAGCLLLGSITFVMGMFYMLLNKDTEIQYYSWSMLTCTISNFMGALAARTIGDAVTTWVVGPDVSKVHFLMVWACICVGWFLVLQIALMLPTSPSVMRMLQTDLYQMQLNFKCFGGLFGLATGFSSLVLWGSIQLLHPSRIPWVAPIVLLAYMCIFYFFVRARRFVNSIHDDSVDAYEKAWMKTCRGTENAVMNLTLSHVIVQSIRFGITGVHPLPTGADPPDFNPTRSDALYLIAFAYLSLVLFFLIEFLPDMEGIIVRRFKIWLKGVFGNVWGFGSFWAHHWFAVSCLGLGGNNGALLMFAASAIIAMLWMMVSHRIATLPCIAEIVKVEVRAVLGPASFLIGFSFKQATLGAIDAINKQLPWQNSVEELVMSLVIAAVVVPAWRWYILPVTKEMEESPGRKVVCHLSHTVEKDTGGHLSKVNPAPYNYGKLPAGPTKWISS